MNIFDEIRTKLKGKVLKYLNTPADHPRPQDDVPDETVIRHLYADYRKYYEERTVLIQYIQRMEKMYKVSQGGLLDITLHKRNLLTKKRVLQELTIIAYNMTKAHLDAQELLKSLTQEEKYSRE